MLQRFLKFLCFIRPFTSKLLWGIASLFLKAPEKGIWDRVKKQPLSVFNTMMSPNNYIADPGLGIFDYTLYNLDYYFYTGNENNIAYGRDCDDSAFVWYNYLQGQPYVEEVFMILCSNGWNIKSLHFFTVAKFTDKKWYLFNYTQHSDAFADLNDACEEFKRSPITVSGKYHNLCFTTYMHKSLQESF